MQQGHHYISIVDWFSAWLNMYHFPPTKVTSQTLISSLRILFIAYGIPEEISTDRESQFTSKIFEDFLSKWGVHHRKSSVEYPQLNGSAELGIKTAKGIIMNNTSPDGSLYNDKAAAAFMQYHNTPLSHLNLSPAQLMLHCVLHDPNLTNSKYELHQEWLMSASDHEKALSERNEEILQKYNSSSKTLPEIPVGTQVMIHQPQKKGVPL